MDKAKTAGIMVLMLALGLVLYSVLLFLNPQGRMGNAHGHADFKLYINGQEWNFSQERYMSEGAGGDEENCTFGETLAHLHNMDGEMVHKHATGVTWGYFFGTFNMSLTESCFTLEDGTAYCDSGRKTLKFFVNGLEQGSLKDYEIRDLDRVLITYGNESGAQIEKQMESVTNKANDQSTGSYCTG